MRVSLFSQYQHGFSQGTPEQKNGFCLQTNIIATTVAYMIYRKQQNRWDILNYRAVEDVLPRSPSSPCCVEDRTMLCGLTGLIGGELVPMGLDGAYEKNLARGGLEVLCW